MSKRLRRPFDLAASIKVLEEKHEGFREDFEAFFRRWWAGGVL